MPVTKAGMRVSTLAASMTLGERPGAAARKVWRGPAQSVSAAQDNDNGLTSVEIAQEAPDALGREVGL